MREEPVDELEQRLGLFGLAKDAHRDPGRGRGLGSGLRPAAFASEALRVEAQQADTARHRARQRLQELVPREGALGEPPVQKLRALVLGRQIGAPQVGLQPHGALTIGEGRRVQTCQLGDPGAGLNADRPRHPEAGAGDEHEEYPEGDRQTANRALVDERVPGEIRLLPAQHAHATSREAAPARGASSAKASPKPSAASARCSTRRRVGAQSRPCPSTCSQNGSTARGAAR